MSVTVTNNEDKLLISFSDAFDFNTRTDFLNAYKDQPSSLAYELDFRKTQSVDSSALGMLMLFREHAGGDSSNITIVGCSTQLMKLFEIARFNTIFTFK